MRRRAAAFGPKPATVAFLLLALVLAVAHVFYRSPEGVRLYLRPAAQAVVAAPSLVWTRALALPDGEQLVAIAAGPDHHLLVSEGEQLRLRWLDQQGFVAAERGWPKAETWALLGPTFVSADRTEEDWRLHFLGLGREAEQTYQLGALESLHLAPMGSDTLVVALFAAVTAVDPGSEANAAADPERGLADRIQVYRRAGNAQQDAASGTAPSPQGWLLTRQAEFPNQAIVQVVAGPGGWAVLTFVPERIARGDAPYRLYVRGPDGESTWERTVAAPGWRLAFVGQQRRTVVWAFRDATVTLFDRAGPRWETTLDGPVEGCWPVDAHGILATCAYRSNGDARGLAVLNTLGDRIATRGLGRGTTWWPLTGTGTLLIHGTTLQAVDAVGESGWSLSLPFRPTLVAMGFGRLLLSDGHTIGLLVWPDEGRERTAGEPGRTSSAPVP